MMLLKLILGHLIGDFFLQPDCLARTKKGSNISLMIHSFINALVIYFIVWNFSLWWIIPIVFFSHFEIDYIKLHYCRDNLFWFITDQILHLAVLLAIWFIIPGNLLFTRDVLCGFLNSERVWMYAIVYSMMTMPVSLFIEKLFKRWAEEIPEYKGLSGAGKLIGYIERFLIVTFVSMGNISAVGFLITAKSVFRFSDIKSSSDFRMTEYVLLGTLVSFALGIIGGLILI